MQIAIIDDLKSDRDLLKMFLKQYIFQHEIFSTIQEFETATSFLSQFRADSYSLIFMDIYMDELSGIDAARKIYQIDKKCRIIFLTSSLTHAVESYEVNAAYYLVKPVTFERLSLALNTSCSSLFHQKENLIVSVKKVSMLIAYHEIIYIDSFSRTPHIHLSNGVIKTDNKLSEIFELLNGKPQFLNCNKDVLVNMDHISHVLDNEFVLSNNEKISIRQRAKNSVKNTYLKYTLRELYSKES